MKRLVLIFFFTPVFAFSQEWRHFGDEIIDMAGIYNFEVINDTLWLSGSVYLKDEGISRKVIKWDSINIDTVPFYGEDGIAIELGSAYDFKIFNGKMFLGGAFHVFSGSDIDYITFWNDTNWLEVGDIGNPSADVNAMVIYMDKLYIGGTFYSIGSESFDRIAAWDGEEWISVDEGFGGIMDGVRDLAIYNNELVAGGMIGIGGGAMEFIGSWDENSWKNLGTGFDGPVFCLTVDSLNNFLYAGGQFYMADDTVVAMFIARWDGYKWENIGQGFNSEPYALGMYRKELYAGGTFYQSGSIPLGYIARWDGEKWDSLQSGVDGGAVFALQEYKEELYVGGMFHVAGGDSVPGIAKWYMPENTSCDYLMPRVFSTADEYYLNSGSVEVQFYNNNAYASSWDWDFGDLGTANIKDPSHIYTDTGVFNVQVTVTDGTCVKTATKTIHIDFDSGLQELDNLNLKVFPNPSENNFTVKTSIDKAVNSELKITGLNGHTKTSIKVLSEETLIDTEGLFVDGKLVKSEKLILK
ncbi:MAG: hypothetical protein UR43_C0031G0004 [candidate division TM6 bacterium GW2011_GWF2_33_332]|nr:MAG: hypothetical protein UR43_C0031G0004 [candidate division TM6 bacterium GW2011_GWF2_33_332]